MKSLLKIFLVLLLALFGFCETGDREPPGDIDDLTFFWDAEALSKKDGEIFIKVQTLPPDTRSLALTATGDNDDDGEASLYDLRFFKEEEYENSNFEDDWSDAHQIINEGLPSDAGEIDALFLPRMDQSKRYYFAIKAKDEIGQESDVSNVVGPVTVPMIAVKVLAQNENKFRGIAAFASLGDFNADELPDFAAGDPADGKALVYYGMKDDEFLFKKKIEDADVHRARDKWLPRLEIKGDSAEGFAAAVAGAGFVNMNNMPDLLVGAPDAEAGAGRAYLFYGRDDMESPLLSDDANSIFSGGNPGDSFGAVVAGCNDLNMDDHDDFAVASPGAEMVYVFLGGSSESSRGSLPGRAGASDAAALIISGENPGDEFGAALDCGKDLNGDNIPDLVISAPANQGRGAVYIFYGGNAGIVNFSSALKEPGSQKVISLAADAADITIRGTVDGARFGQVVRLAGDLRGRPEEDPTTDLAVSATGLDPGEVLVFYGGNYGNLIFPLEITSPIEDQDIKRDILLAGEAGEEFGAALAGGWDFNEDGNDDLVVGMPGAGGAVIYYWDSGKGADELLTYIVSHPDPASRFGEIILALPDFSRDDVPDLIIAAPAEGKAYFEF